MAAEHVVDWRFEGLRCAVEAEAEGPALAEAAQGALDALAEAGHAPPGELELSILLTDDGTIQPLNAQWRGKDSPTDVLSFPMEEGAILGDVVISVETAMERVAGEEWHLADELLFLLIHGILHLLGFDHESEDERVEMEAAEQAVWTALGRTGTLRDPERSP